MLRPYLYCSSHIKDQVYILNPGDSVNSKAPVFGVLWFSSEITKKSFLVPQTKLCRGVQAKEYSTSKLQYKASSSSWVFVVSVPYTQMSLRPKWFLDPTIWECYSQVSVGQTELQWPERARVAPQRNTFSEQKQSCDRSRFRTVLSMQQYLWLLQVHRGTSVILAEYFCMPF